MRERQRPSRARPRASSATMYRLFCSLAGLTVLASPAAAASPQYIHATLISESITPRSGQSILVGLQMNPEPGWHGYWSNPGESGLAPVVKWTAPRGVHLGPLQHPAPTLLRTMGLVSFVHSGPHLLLARLMVDRGLRVGTVLPLTADVAWAACSDRLCVPQKARLALTLKVGNGSLSPFAAKLRQARVSEPKLVAGGSFQVRRGQIVLALPPLVRLRSNAATFFPDQNGYWDATEAHVIRGHSIEIAGPVVGKAPLWVTGVVSDGISAYRLRLKAAGQR